MFMSLLRRHPALELGTTTKSPGLAKKRRRHTATAVGCAMLALLVFGSLPQASVAQDAARTVQLKGDGLLRTRSAYPVAETAERIEASVDEKGIMFFAAIDQSKLGQDAGIELPPSTLLLFGNPPLGVLFLTANPESGMDWPVRMLVHQDADGSVWVVYQDWAWVAERYRITDREAEFAKATEVVAALVSSVADCAVLADCTR